MNWWQGLLIGGGIGLIFVPVIYGIRKFFHNALERRKIKLKIKRGEFLIPIDKKDYDSIGPWKSQITKDYSSEIIDLNAKIFKNPDKEDTPIPEVRKEVLNETKNIS